MVDDISSSLEPQLLIDNLTIIKDVDPNAYLIANQKHIYQLIRNLIDNAIKYNVLNGKIFVNIKKKWRCRSMKKRKMNKWARKKLRLTIRQP